MGCKGLTLGEVDKRDWSDLKRVVYERYRSDL